MNPCRASDVETGDGEFMPSTAKEAVANIFKPASAIVNEVLLDELADEPCPSLPKPINLVLKQPTTCVSDFDRQIPWTLSSNWKANTFQMTFFAET